MAATRASAAQSRSPQIGEVIVTPLRGQIGIITAINPPWGVQWNHDDGTIRRSLGQDLRWDDAWLGWVMQSEPEEKTIPTTEQIAASIEAVGAEFDAHMAAAQQIEGIMVAGSLPAGLPTLGDTLVAGPGVTGPAPTAAQFDRLLALLSLTPQERAFVRAALEPGAEADLFDVVADYLEESGRPAHARFRESEAVRQEREACLATVQSVQTMGGRGDTYADGYRQAVVQATTAIRSRGGVNT